MNTLLMRLAAPMQSWGIDAKFNRRGTGRTPSKSGVIGLVAAALGRKRNESIADLQQLQFGVRVDREGKLIRDYQMVHEEAFWKNHAGRYVHITNRYYLADAVFLVGLTGEPELLKQIEWGLRNPVFPLFLGRRSCPPEGKLVLGIREGKSLMEALEEEPWLVSDWLQSKRPPQEPLRIAVESDAESGHGYFLKDLPLSFDQNHRQYGFRRVVESLKQVEIKTVSDENMFTEHDPMKALN